jgi:hypothetical protein
MENFTFATITGLIMQGFGAIFRPLGVSGETGNGLLEFVRFFGVMGDLIVRFFQRIFSGFSA